MTLDCWLGHGGFPLVGAQVRRRGEGDINHQTMSLHLSLHLSLCCTTRCVGQGTCRSLIEWASLPGEHGVWPC